MASGYGSGKIIGKLADGRYQGQWTDATGRRRKKALAFTKRDAEMMLREIVVLRDRAILGIGTETPDCLWRDGVRSYLSDMRNRVKKDHYLSTLNALERYQAFSKVIRMNEVSRDSVRAWRDSLLDDGLCNRTANKLVGAIQTFTKFCDYERKAEDQLKGLKPLGSSEVTKKRLTRSLSSKECEALLKVLEPKHRAVVLFLLNTGLRWGELSRVQEEDVSRMGVRVSADTKTGEGRFVPFGNLNSRAVEALEMIEAPGARNLFGIDSRTSNFLLRVFNPALKAAGIPKRGRDGRVVHVHTLRHTFATGLANAGVPLKVAQKVMGHKSIKMLAEVYVHIEEDDVRLHLDRT